MNWRFSIYLRLEKSENNLIFCNLSVLSFLVLSSIQALESGKLSRGGVVTEGSAGSTAISLATVAPTYGCKCHVVIPDDAAIEKVCTKVFCMRKLSVCT